ncbi:MAG: c-type cytochrome [Alphaproteobacteria bacterium]|nr:c-type cytochrome [Alphaproteobacteria bacterium]
MTRVMILAGMAAVLALVVWGAGWMMDGPGDPPVSLRADDRALVAQGQGIYRQHCAACHGDRLEGQPEWRTRGADGLLPAPPHDATGHTWHHPDAVLVALTKYGPGGATGNPDYRSNMPAYAEVLNDDEIVAVLSYIKAQWPPEIRARHDELNDRAGAD